MNTFISIVLFALERFLQSMDMSDATQVVFRSGRCNLCPLFSPGLYHSSSFAATGFIYQLIAHAHNLISTTGTARFFNVQ